MAVIHGMSQETCSILKHFGIDPKKTKNVTIFIPCDDVITVQIEQYVHKEDLNKEELETKKYNLIPIEKDV